ncbi:glycoside hydrolase family 65 protein [Undibacterium sp. SXout11W]|uniref:glycoside hydrolase family 65 protein n=1 Tax=Undibacterium sp. SXout11W TaxID=3413050 RepID=UPI003BEF75C8
MSLPVDSHHTFALDSWKISEGSYDVKNNYLLESLFAQGNGTIGLRGTHEESYCGPAGSSQEGNYLNGFYESEPITYPENAFGLARNNHFMLNLPNGKGLELWLADEVFNLANGRILSYQRELDFKTGILTRIVRWESPKGRQIEVQSERLVSFVERHLYATRYRVTALNFNAILRLVSTLDANVKNLPAGDDPRVGSKISAPPLQMIRYQNTPTMQAMEHKTTHSEFHLVSAIAHASEDWTAEETNGSAEQQVLERYFSAQIEQGQCLSLCKFGSYFSSRDYPAKELMQRSVEYLERACEQGFEYLATQQAAYLDAFWQKADVEIAGDPALQQGIHFNQFHLLQSVGRDGQTNIAAKGLSGEGYEGHYFWDTEIYILPFFLYSKPEIAKKLLEYRYRGLAHARQRAREMGHQQGALYPWRTIGGEECSAYFPAGSAQYHINADIAYAVKQYLDATGDSDFIVNGAAEMVWETARIWLGLGHFPTSTPEVFCINEVTGPDEYTALVNNNYYTNAMAKAHLEFALRLVEQLQQESTADYMRIKKQIGLQDEEIIAWRKAAQSMYLPYDEALKIHAQDDSFLAKKKWDFAGTTDDKYPLLLHFHPLVIYRHQVCKQADLLLAMLLQSDQFTLPEKRRNFEYYEKITTHDSSLSSCIFSIIAAEIGEHEKAYSYFMETARLDLDDTHNNTKHGIHTAAMAGTWMCIAYGFGGMRVINGELHFSPNLPQQWQYYQFQINFKRATLNIRIDKEGTEYRLVDGDEIHFHHGEQSMHLNPEQRRVVILK